MFDMSRRWVLHIDMDAFFASVEQLTRPALRGRPVLVGGISGRGVVAGASYEARALGARSAMPMFQAKALVGFSGVVVAPRHAVYAAASRKVFELVKQEAGVIEQLSIDEAFMEPAELVGASEDQVRAWAQQLRAKIRQHTGLPSSIGCGGGKQAAKIGSGMAKPDGVYVIPPERQAEILGPLPVRKLWGVGPVAEVKLARVGVETIADFAALEPREVESVLGKAVGVALWEVARGNDTSPVMPRAEAKSVGAEYTYPKDLVSKAHMDQAIERAFVKAIARLRRDGRGARTVSVKLKLSDFHTESRSHSFVYPTEDEQALRHAVGLLVRYPDEVGPIRLVGVSFSNLEYPSQEMLFPELLPVKPVVVKEEDYETGVRSAQTSHAEVTVVDDAVAESTSLGQWFSTQDVSHPEFGHGWIQGAGHGIVTVRFETRASEKSFIKTFPVDDPLLEPADPLVSLDWPEVFATSDHDE
ncbi:DNA polymerase IV [Corynebacterium felinum]|nr:DNA polymerase IV [Corynebacterium felinum]MDF5820933.1 DNA polymerase IV [Corynebacterium felinum]